MWAELSQQPTSAVASQEDLESAMRYCREHDIALLHDAAYSEVGYDGYRAAACCNWTARRTLAWSFTHCPSPTT